MTWGSSTATWDDLDVTWAGHHTVVPDVIASGAPRPLADLLVGSHTRLAEAMILTGPAAGQVLPIIAGTLTFEEDAPIRLSGSLTVVAVEPWTSQEVSAALDPRLGVELQLRHGALGDDGTPHWWPLGVVRPTRHALTRTARAIEVTLTVDDRSGAMSRAGADRMQIIPAGFPIAAGVMSALRDRFPWLAVELSSEDDPPASSDIILAERAGDDLWGACREVMRSVGRNLHVNAVGAAVAPLRVAARSTPPISVPVTAASVEVDVERVVHAVEARVQVWNPDFDINDYPESQPLLEESVVAADDEAIAALPPHVPVRTVAYSGDETMLSGPDQAYIAAAAELADLHDVIASGGCRTIPHPDVMPGAVISPLGDGERYRITRMTLPLGGGEVDVSLGNSSRTLSRRLAERLGLLQQGPNGERMEIVTSADPLMTRQVAAGADAPSLRADNFIGQVSIYDTPLQVGEIVNVMHYGRGRRAVTSRWTLTPTWTPDPW